MKKYRFYIKKSKFEFLKVMAIIGLTYICIQLTLLISGFKGEVFAKGIFSHVSGMAGFMKTDRQDVALFKISPIMLIAEEVSTENVSKNLEENYENYVEQYEELDLVNQPQIVYEQEVETQTMPQETVKEDYLTTNTIVGEVYNYEQLLDLDYLTKNFYTITSTTSLNSSIFNVKEALKADLSIEKNSDEPQILIMHTHSQETFVDSVEGDYSTYIVGVGAYLAEILREKYGYNVIHDTSTYDIMEGKLDRSDAYNYANEGIEKMLAKYPSIKVVLDVHRDGVNENTHLVTEINGKKTAKVMFFNGLSYSNVNGPIEYLKNPNLQENLAMSLQMQLLTKAYYPDFTRKIYLQAYRYSLHHRGRSMLLEVGAQTNTLEEVMNAMEPLADTLDKCLSGKKVYETSQ